MTQKITQSYAYKAARDFMMTAGVMAAVPYVIPSLVRELRDSPKSSTDGNFKSEYKGQEAFFATGAISGMGLCALQVPLYFNACHEGYPEVLGIPVAANIVSYLYPHVKKGLSKLKQKFKDRNKRISLTQDGPNQTLEQKLSLSERIFGKKQTTLEVSPRISLNPKITVYVNDEKQENVRVEVEESPKDESKPNQVNPLNEYKIKSEPFYISNDGEINLFKTAYQRKLPVMLKGPTGCGKTRFVEHMAYELGRPLITVNCQEDLSATDLVGRILLNGEGTYWQDGPLTKAARNGGICYLDEIVEARNDAMVLIHSLTDHRRILPIDKTGEVIEAHPDFMLVISYNPHYQSALKDMKQSTRQRFIAMEFDYPSAAREVEVVEKESGVDKKTAEKLVAFGQKVRAMKGQGLREGASTRLLAYAGKLISSGVDTQKAVQTAIVNPITDEPDLQRSVMDVARTIL